MRAILAALLLVIFAAPALAEEPDRTKVVVFVVGDKPLARATRSTTLLTFEHALKQDLRLIVLDKDLQLAEQGGAYDKNVIDEARGLLATGEALLEKGSASEALARLTTAEQQLETVLPFVKKRELARAQFLVGVANAKLGKEEPARAAFVRLLTWRPEFAVDASVSGSGGALPLFDEASKIVARLPKSTARIRALPDNAQAYVDGEFAGFTPTSKKGLVVGTHYVTVRSEGYVRQVRKIVVEPDRSTHVRTELERSPAWDAMVDTVERIKARLGERKLADPLSDLRMLLAVDHAVFLHIDGQDYAAHVYDLRTGKRLAQATLSIGEQDDPQVQFEHLAEAVYSEAFRIVEVQKPKAPKRKTHRGTPFYKKWWFWTGVGVAAAAVSVPFLLPDGSADGATCPDGHVCGEVLFRF